MSNEPNEPDTSEIVEQSRSAVGQANAIVIRDHASLEVADGLLRAVKTIRARIRDTFAEPIRAAHAAHKAMIAARDKHDKPLAQAEATIKLKRGEYVAEQERKRREEEARLREIARREEEERRLAEAQQLEAEGRNDEAEAVLDEPIETPPVVVSAAVPKSDGISTRKTWTYRIVDEAKIPRQYLIPDTRALGSLARSLREKASVPGVEFYAETSTAVRGY